MKETLKIVGVGILIVWGIFMVLAIMLSPLLITDYYACGRLEQKIGMETRYDLWYGCLVHPNNEQWIPLVTFTKNLIDKGEKP